MKITIIFAIILFISSLTGCASAPRYKYEGHAIGQVIMPFEQAWAVCEPQAGITAQQAYNSSLMAGQQNQNCQLGQFNYYGCRASVGFSNLGNSISALGTRQQTYDAALSSCLAAYGWRTSTVCVENCQ